MRFNDIFGLFIAFLVISSVGVLLIGLYETARLEGTQIIENNNIMSSNASITPPVIYADYLSYKSNYMFTNAPAISFMNFLMYTMIFYLFYYSWNKGRSSPPFALSAVFTSYSLLLILGIYIFSVVIEYLINIFVDQLIIVLYSEIYSGIYMYALFIDNYIYLMLGAYFLSWFANQLKYFDILRNN